MSDYLKRILTPEQIDELQEIGIGEIKRFFEKQQREQQAVCHCKACEDERAAIEAQLDHPFYDRVDAFRDEIKAETMIKAAKKYKEPFNPGSWSIKQLGKHAMAENYDQGNYIVGLMEAAEHLQEENEKIRFAIVENCQLRKEIEQLKSEAEYWRLRAVANAENIEKINQQKGVNVKMPDFTKGVFIDERV